MATNNCYVNSKIIDNATYLAKTRARLVPNYDLNFTKWNTWTGTIDKTNTYIKCSNTTCIDGMSDGIWVVKSKTKQTSSKRWLSYVYLKNGTQIGWKNDKIFETKIGDYYYYFFETIKKYIKDIRFIATNYFPAGTFEESCEVEIFRVNDECCYTRTQFVKWFAELPTITTTKTLTLGSKVLAKLTDEDKKIATDKGWTLA